MVTERGKEAYQASKHRTRTRPELSKTQLRKFLELMAEAAGSGAFEIHLGLSQSDIAWVKDQLQVESPDDARRMLKDTYEQDDVDLEAAKVEERELHRKLRAERQARLDAEEARKRREAEERRVRLKKMTDPKAIREEQQRRQQRLDAQEQPEVEVTEDDWVVEEDAVEYFKGIVSTRGVRFAADMYGVNASDIRREVNRLFPWMDMDILPR